nr:sulfatase-like hydrolase/transferase [candidate division Zixibacteria bacterium]
MTWYKRIPNKVSIWFGIYLLGIIIGTLMRLMFLLYYRHLVGDSPFVELLHSFWLGFRFDTSVVSIIILPLFLISLLPFINFKRKLDRAVFILPLAVVFILSLFISVAELRFFEHFGSRMNYWAIEYLESPGMFFYSIEADTSFWFLLPIWIVTAVLFMYVIRWIFIRFSSYHSPRRIFRNGLIYLIVTALLAFGIRGRLGMKGIDWGIAFFSDSQFLNQLSLNPVFSLSHSIYEELKDGKTLFGYHIHRFSFYDNDEAYKTVAGMLELNPDPNPGNYSLDYVTEPEYTLGFHPNIVLVIMESWAAGQIGILGSNLGLTPCFDSLSRHGILFTDFYANGIRTNRGIPAVTCSFPSLPGRSIMKRYAADYPFRSLAQVLDDFDYTSIFTYGGDIEFDNMRGFLKSVGYSKFYGEKAFDNTERLSKWGIFDHVVFKKLVKDIDRYPRPFNLTIMTISNHEPYLIPDDRFKLYADTVPDYDRLNTFYYSDWAIGQLVDGFRGNPVFDSTIFVFTADHCPHQSSRYPLDPDKFHIPLLIYAPGILGDSAITIDRTASQVDIIPTLAGLILSKAKIHSWGRDQFHLGKDDPGFAVIVDEEKTGMIVGNKFYFHWVNALKQLFNLNDTPYLEKNLADSLPEIAADMDKKLNSYIQLANLLSRGEPKFQKRIK